MITDRFLSLKLSPSSVKWIERCLPPKDVVGMKDRKIANCALSCIRDTSLVNIARAAYSNHTKSAHQHCMPYLALICFALGKLLINTHTNSPQDLKIITGNNLTCCNIITGGGNPAHIYSS